MVQKVKLYNILLRPQVNIGTLAEALPELRRFLAPYESEFVELAEINIKYEGYIVKQSLAIAEGAHFDGSVRRARDLSEVTPDLA